MAEASLSDFFCDSIVDFLTELSTSELDQLLNKGKASVAMLTDRNALRTRTFTGTQLSQLLPASG